MATIKILKNNPKLNSYGQYRFEDTDINLNLSVSGEFNSKFLDDDLYTTALENTVNEDIINNDYDIQEEPSLSLTVKIKNVVKETNKSIKFKVALFDETIDGFREGYPFLSDDYRTNDTDYPPPKKCDGDVSTGITDGDGNIIYEDGPVVCTDTMWYNHYKKIVKDSKYQIWSRSNYGQKKNFNPKTIIDNEKILENFATDTTNGIYYEDFSSYSKSGFNIDDALSITLENWGEIDRTAAGKFYVVVWTHAHKDLWVGTDRRDARVQVFEFNKRDFKYLQSDPDTWSNPEQCNQSDAAADPQGTNCWIDDGTYYKGNTSEISITKTGDNGFRGNEGGGAGKEAPAFKCTSVTMKVVPPYQMDISQSDIPENYQKIIEFPKVLTSGNYSDFFELNPHRIINYSYLTHHSNGLDVVDFQPISEVTTANNTIDLQQYYTDFDKKFKSSAPGFVELSFDIKILNILSFELEDFPISPPNYTAFAYFVVDWNDSNKKFENWEDVLGDFPTSYGGLYEKQQDDNTYNLRSFDGDMNPNTTFNTLANLQHFYRTSGLKTIKSVVFSYASGSSGLQALRWKLVTTRIFLNENRVTKEDFGELGTLGFTTIPWPRTSPIISGISKLSKYYDSVENVLYNNRFADDELLSETKVYNALLNDELGDYVGDVDIEQTRYFAGARDMDQLLMLESMFSENLVNSNLTTWYIYNNSNNDAITDDSGTETTATITITNGGSFRSDIQFIEDDIKITDGKEYKVEFNAYASEARTMEVHVKEYGDDFNQTGGNYDNLGLIGNVSLTSSMEHYKFDFIASDVSNLAGVATNPNAKLNFYLGNTSASQWDGSAITISDVSIREKTTIGIAESEYHPYTDIYDGETNSDGYWANSETKIYYPDFDESCVGLIFISDSSNTTLKRDCLIELNMGDVENGDNIIDTSGNSNMGILIGDYSIKKESILVPLTRDSNMKLPETDNKDRAI